MIFANLRLLGAAGLEALAIHAPVGFSLVSSVAGNRCAKPMHASQPASAMARRSVEPLTFEVAADALQLHHRKGRDVVQSGHIVATNCHPAPKYQKEADSPSDDRSKVTLSLPAPPITFPLEWSEWQDQLGIPNYHGTFFNFCTRKSENTLIFGARCLLLL